MKGKKMTEQQETFKERQRRNKAPLQFALFKGVRGKFGAMRLNLKKAYTDDRREKDDGCLFLEMAPAIGPNEYDWNNSKIIMALGMSDIPKIMLYLRAPGHPQFQKSDGKLKLYHDKGAGSSTKGQNTTNLTIDKPADRDNFFLSIFQSNNGTNKNATVTISADEAIAMGTLLQAAIPLIMAWWPDAPQR
jgi:hypothetical protein